MGAESFVVLRPSMVAMITPNSLWPVIFDTS